MDLRFIEGIENIKYRNALLSEYLGKEVHIDIDRPIGYIHKKEKYSLHYTINYGYIKDVLGGDGEDLDVYLMGVNDPVDKYDCKIIAAIRRKNDIEDKLVAAPLGMNFSEEQIKAAVDFQEQYYNSFIITDKNDIK